jgi:hypothetical protein
MLEKMLRYEFDDVLLVERTCPSFVAVSGTSLQSKAIAQWSRNTKECPDQIWFAICLVGESWCSLREMEGENNKDCNGAVSLLIFGVLGSRSRRWRVDWTFCCMGGSRAPLILDLQETLVPPRMGSQALDLQSFKPHFRDMS